MKVILDKKLINEKGLKDFDLDPVNKDLVAVGKKLYFVSQDLEGKVIIKELGGKLKNIEGVKFIKEENQLFVSNSFLVLTMYGEIFKYYDRKHKASKTVFSMERTPDYINFTTNGKIIYLLDDILYSYNPNSEMTIKKPVINKNNDAQTHPICHLNHCNYANNHWILGLNAVLPYNSDKFLWK